MFTTAHPTSLTWRQAGDLNGPDSGYMVNIIEHPIVLMPALPDRGYA
jgi:hypothetical protein